MENPLPTDPKLIGNILYFMNNISLKKEGSDIVKDKRLLEKVFSVFTDKRLQIPLQ